MKEESEIKSKKEKKWRKKRKKVGTKENDKGE